MNKIELSARVGGSVGCFYSQRDAASFPIPLKARFAPAQIPGESILTLSVLVAGVQAQCTLVYSGTLSEVPDIGEGQPVTGSLLEVSLQ